MVKLVDTSDLGSGIARCAGSSPVLGKLLFYFLLLYTPFLMPTEKRTLQNGVYAAALTPMNADLSCNHEKLIAHCFHLINHGCTGVALFGTTGEGPSFSLPERIEVLHKLCAAGFPSEKIILANGSSGIFETVALCKEALKLGCASMLIAPPSFYKNVSELGVISFYREIIQKVADSNLQILLYHIPQFSGVPITLNIIESLRAEFPEIIIGIKESAGDLPFTKKILERFSQFKVFVGSERQITETFKLGGAGTIGGVANLYPEIICALYHQDLSANIDAFFAALNQLSYISAAKAVMKKKRRRNLESFAPSFNPLR